MTNLLQSHGLSPACHRHIKRATRAAPGAPLLTALIADVERSKEPLAKNTVHVYAHEFGRIISAAVVDGLASEAEGAAAVDRVRTALIAKLDADITPRTSALKVTALTASELGKLFRAIKTKALAQGDMDLGLIGLMIVALAILGVRPVELTTLEQGGGFLRVQTAKRARTAHPYRVFDVHGTPRTWIDAMLLAARIYGAVEDIETFYRVHRKLAQILARISQQTLGRRVSFYCFRHIAMATWKLAGISGADVALLAGHISPRTAQHYAPAKAGHVGPVRIKAVPAADVPQGLFPDRALSPLIKPARASRGTQMSVVETAGLNEDTPLAIGTSEPRLPKINVPVEVTPHPPVHKDHTYRRRTIGSQWRARQKEREQKLERDPDVSPSPLKTRDEFVIPEMPIPVAAPTPRPIDPSTYVFEMTPDPEFDAAIAALMEMTDEDVHPDYAMPLPYELSQDGDTSPETSRRSADAIERAELRSKPSQGTVPQPSYPAQRRR